MSNTFYKEDALIQISLNENYLVVIQIIYEGVIDLAFLLGVDKRKKAPWNKYHEIAFSLTMSRNLFCTYLFG